MKIMIFGLILFLFCFALTKCEVFTALADLEEVLETETYLISTLDNYIRAEHKRLEYLKKYANIFRIQHSKAGKNARFYVANPINAYTLVKRLTTDWKEVEHLINTDLKTDYITNITYIKENMKFPNDEDLYGAAVALTRLQDTYRLDTSLLASGELNGKKYASELSAADCFELGRQSYYNDDYYHSELWMREADNRLNREVNETVERSEILEYLAFSTYKQGNIPLALDLTNKILEILPTHPRALENKVFYENKLQKTVTNEEKDDKTTKLPEPDHLAFRENYEQLCRGEISLSEKKASKLKCRYLKNKPFLMLAPFKVEEAHHKPDILIFYDVLADSEIATMKRLAQPRRAMVVSKTGEAKVAQYRISKSGWVFYDEHKHITQVTQRVSDMTGLTMETAELLQVVNYGIGGQYEPHFDFTRKEFIDRIKDYRAVNRIATVLFYLSDVEQGGATVFPYIRLALLPQKGSAAFWFNLHESGDGDIMTLHAACPVLIGTKWVANQWIYDIGQEFLRPCTNERPNEDLVI